MKGNGITWHHSSLSPITDITDLKSRSSFYLPLKKYVNLYISKTFFLNELGVRNFVQKVRNFVDADYIWVNDIQSTTDWRSGE